MSQPRLVLHIGPHKTGTTYLQSRLLQHAAALRAHSGINYVQAGIGPQFGHHKLCAELRQGGPGEAWAAAAQEWTHYPCHIISSENFSRLPPAAVATLAELLAGLKVEICYVLRRPEALLYAAWQEQVKHGSPHSLPEFVAPHLAAPAHSPLLNPQVLLAPYLQAFEGRLRVLSYDAIRAEGHSLVTALFEGLQLGAAPATDNAVVNKSMRLDRAEALRALNAWELSRHAVGQASPFMRADGALFNTRQFLAVAKQSPTCLAHLISAQEGHLRELPQASGSALQQPRQQFLAQHPRACVGPWRDTADGPPPAAAETSGPGLPWVQSAWLLRPGVPDALAELAALVRQAEPTSSSSSSAAAPGE
ncbi:MAG: hypothetical protein U5L74_15295 [Ideonella sp.]|nr:hypothetical protein [Ideonella sp.]